jgi:hypothetical protein
MDRAVDTTKALVSAGVSTGAFAIRGVTYVGSSMISTISTGASIITGLSTTAYLVSLPASIARRLFSKN